MSNIQSTTFVCFGKTGAYLKINRHSCGNLLSPFKVVNQWSTSHEETLLEQFSVESDKICSFKMCHYLASTVKSSMSGSPEATKRELYRNRVKTKIVKSITKGPRKVGLQTYMLLYTEINVQKAHYWCIGSWQAHPNRPASRGGRKNKGNKTKQKLQLPMYKGFRVTNSPFSSSA